MRIISGKHKGRRLQAPKKLPVRPTTDRAKEGLFNILGNRFDFSETSVLDLFSGTGNMAYEFASREAQKITAVDKNRDCARFIERTSTELEMQIHVIKSDVFGFLEKHANPYDIIFADPPYNFNLDELTKIVDLCHMNNLLKPDGVLVIEHATQHDLSNILGFEEKRKYGSSVFSFFEM
jgi:16S rRNA (guanine(966)-N(2))-methyltransferase RsmD